MGFFDKLSEFAENASEKLQEAAERQARVESPRLDKVQEKLSSYDYEKLNDNGKKKYDEIQSKIDERRDLVDKFL